MPGKTASLSDLDDVTFSPFDFPSSEFYLRPDMDPTVAAIGIPINGNWDIADSIVGLSKEEKYLSTSPQTFLSSFLNTEFSTSPPSSNGFGNNCVKGGRVDLQLRNHDCMWSGRCNHQENHLKMKQKMMGGRARPVTSLSQRTSTNSVSGNSTTHTNGKRQATQPAAGQSLLRSQQQPLKLKIGGDKHMPYDENNNNNNRPDTPLSLEGNGNDAPEFKHNIDLTTTLTGSNRLPLIGSPKSLHDEQLSINKIKEYLENPAINKMSFGSTASLNDLNDLVDYVECRNGEDVDDDEDEDDVRGDEYLDDEGISSGDNHHELKRILKSGGKYKMFNDDEEDEDEDVDDDDASTRAADEDEEDEDEDEDADSGAYDEMESDQCSDYNNAHHQVAHSTIRQPVMTATTLTNQQQSMHSDHSYTRCKTRVDTKNLGVDTPSDSEEEIDPVGNGEKKNLPTNPSAKDRRALQATVAHRIGKGGLQPVAATASVGNVRHLHQHQRSSNNNSTYNLMAGVTQTSINNSRKLASGRKAQSSSRKRPHTGSGYAKSGSKHHHDGGNKKSKYSAVAKRNGGSSMHKKSRIHDYHDGVNHYSSHNSGHHSSSSASSVTNFTLEKRNLHNDLERQRRIGLKNLFEELKCQIPSLRDKERAPKVSILREAANLCSELSHEQEVLFALRKQRERLLQNLRTLKSQLQRSTGGGGGRAK